MFRYGSTPAVPRPACPPLFSGAGQLSSVDSFEKGIYYLGACLPIMVCGMYSAIKQGKVAAAGIVTISKRPEASGKTVTATAMVELYALLALIISILLVTNNPF